ncbi:hypothetical protein [Dongia sp.]|uniref:hypothetical protein n=1 Tax=Dongia sp. TaxID=1977262 RepID=UPI0035B3A659
MMSFCAQDLSVLAYANGFTHWHYRSPDDLASILADDRYFAPAATMLRPGDQITLNLIGADGISLAHLGVTAIAAPDRVVATLLAATEQPLARLQAA